jgi:hypothetical protein
MTFKRTTPLTALDLDPSDIPDAGPSSKGGVTLQQIADIAEIYASGSVGADALAILRLQRETAVAATVAAGQSQIDYADAAEITESWADMTAWSTAGVQVSSNRLYGVAGANPSAAIR